MDKILEQSYLYDFYGELLTEHQKQIYEEVVFDDCSLSEVAEANGISRQGVHDLIKRCDRALRDYEDKLGLVHKFRETQRYVDEILAQTEKFEETKDPECVRRIRELSLSIGEL